MPSQVVSRVSRYEMGIMMARCLDMPTVQIEPVTIESYALGVARSPDCALDSRKAFHLGYNPEPLADAIRRVVEQFNAINR